MNAISFAELRPGDTARIVRYDNSDPGYRQKLMSLGLTPGVELKLVRRAPMGDPVEIRLRGFNLGVRAAEASCIMVERIPN
jgi:ferrous iron transport protein A